MSRILTAREEPSYEKRALLIGVRTYPFIPGEYGQPLAGCHNDVVHMREALLARGFNEDWIRVLVDWVEGCPCLFCEQEVGREKAAPTRKGILSAVHDLWAATADGDIAVIYYSGHGSEFSGRGLYVGQRFQTIVPHDSGRGEEKNRDIADREIEGWIREFSQKTPYLTLIFDCCHSGGIADLRSDARVGRKVQADERTDPDAFSSGLNTVLGEGPSEGLRGASGWLRGAGRSAVVLSASAAKELSSETAVGGKKQGLFTHNLTKALLAEGAAERSWAELFPQIAEGVTEENLAQHPRREGNAPIFAPGEVDPKDVYPPDVIRLKKLAVVIGIDYSTSQETQGKDGKPRVAFPPLRAPQCDAVEVARALEEVQGYEIVGLSSKRPGPLLNEKATRARIHKLIHRLVTVRTRTQRECAVVIYFAGHGVVRTLGDGKSAGYLVPWDADRDDSSTWLAMKDLRDQLVDGIRDQERLACLGQSEPLARLTSRHLLLVLDCCFGGALAFDFFRGSDTPDRPIYYSEYKRFVEGTAWQLLSSASYNQQAMDRDPKDPDDPHSPFARALIEGLTTDRADIHRQGAHSDKIITATELHQFIDTRLKQQGVDIQTPGLMPLRPIQGQFIFHVPGCEPTPLPDPELRRESNPWRGADAYGDLAGGDGAAVEESFHGRDMATFRLLESFLALPRPTPQNPKWPSLVVVGPSGSGATSLVRSGLLPLLAHPVAGRKRIRSYLTRRGLKHYLVSRKDLKAVRSWAGSLTLSEWLDRPDALADKVREWSVKEGLLSTHKGSAVRRQEQIEMEHYGVPSFAQGVGDEEAQGWVRRLGLLKLLETPETLAVRLRFWLIKGGVADFLSAPDRTLGGLVGRWEVITGRPATVGVEDTTKKKNALLLIDREELETVETWQEVWRDLASGPRIRTIATVRADALVREPVVREALAAADVEGRPLWYQVAVPKASREELQEVITGPASAKVLFFEPPELVDHLLAEVEYLPVPLPLLSMMLSKMYARAWDRRGDGDRQLLAEDLGAKGAMAFLAEQAERTWCRLADQGPEMLPILQALFQRLVSQDSEQASGRQITWRELDLVHPAARQRLESAILPAFLKDRILVAAKDHVELASHQLITSWPRLNSESLAVTKGGGNTTYVDLQIVWRRALEWEGSGFDRGKLWARDPIVRSLIRSTTLNQLEWAFVVASEMERRSTTIKSLLTFAVQYMHRVWDRCAVLIGAAADLAIETQQIAGQLLKEPLLACGTPWAEARAVLRESRDLSVCMAEQALRDILAETPFSVPLTMPHTMPVPGKVQGLRFDGKEALQVRIDDQVWVWNLRALDQKPQQLPATVGPRAGEAEAAMRWYPLLHDVAFPTVSAGFLTPVKARASYDGAIRFLAPLRRRLLGPPKVELRTLLGHRGVPVFLAFSKSRFGVFRSRLGPCEPKRWLVSAANSPAGAEVRCWPVGRSWNLPGEPQTFLGKKLGEVFRQGTSEVGQRIRGSDPLPVKWTVSGTVWQIESLAQDGSSFVMRNLESDGCQIVELSSQACQAGAKKEAEESRPPSLLGLGLRPVLAELGAPPVPLDFLPPWLRRGKQGIREIVCSSDGRWLAASSESGAAGLWSLPDFRLVWSAGGAEDPSVGKGKRGGITFLAMNPKAGAEVALAVGTEVGNPWFIAPGRSKTAPEEGPMGRISSMVWSPDGERLAIGTLDGSVHLWNVPSSSAAQGIPPVVLKCRSGFAVRELAFDEEGKRLAVERRAVYEPYEHRVDIHQLDLHKLIRLARGHTGRELESSELPVEIWLNLFDVSIEEIEKERKGRREDRERKETEKRLYLTALGLLD
jgi:hypothetical protein